MAAPALVLVGLCFQATLPARAEPAEVAEPLAAGAVNSAGSPEYAATIRRAVDAYQQHNLSEAIRLFEQAHALEPSARTHRAIGIAWFELGDYAQASARLRLALEDPRRPLNESQRAESETLLAEALARQPTPPITAPAPEQRPPVSAVATPIPPPPESPKPASGLGAQRVWALIAGGVGVVGVTVGAVAGIRSISLRSESDDHCPNTKCDERGVEAMDESIVAGNISTVALSIGGAALAAGLVLWLAGAPSESDSKSRAAAFEVGPGSVRLSARF